MGNRLLLCQGLLFVGLMFQAYHVSANCTWYGQCGVDPKDRSKIYNCPYNGPPKAFQTSKGIADFKSTCGDLYNATGIKTCCSDKQIATLSNQLKLAGSVLKRCPNCLKNFNNLWCYITCDKIQHKFLHINHTVTQDSKVSIDAVDFVVTNTYVDGVFNSCANVVNPLTNGKAIALMCRDSSQCTPKKFMDYLGDVTAYSPFQINTHLTNEKIVLNGTVMDPFNTTSYKCNVPLPGSVSACSCQDCPASCAQRPTISPPPKACQILHVDCYVFAFTIVFATFLLFFGSYSICYNIIVQDSLRLEKAGHTESVCCWGSPRGLAASRNDRKREFLDHLSHEQLNRVDRFSAWLETFWEDKFTKWGHICARRPFIVIIVSLILGVVLCAGFAKFTVTTDPVKLWAGPNSRSRTEMEYFNTHFAPFYRTEQIIISRPHNNTVIPNIDTGHNYTSLFDLTFLNEMLDLQLEVEALSTTHNGKNVTLKDICFSPLSPQNNNCTIQSILNYYQNSHKNLNNNATLGNYLDHFHTCVNSPTSMTDDSFNLPCMGTFGGPVDPWVALGGYIGSNYRSARAFVITFVVNNYEDPSQNGPAEAWEKVFVSFMKEYVKTHPHISIAFSSERSIEDEIKRESSSDVTTILVSYLIMFGYITFTLGQYQGLGWILFQGKAKLGFHRMLVDAKILLGLSGVIIVLLSVFASLGFYSYVGIPSTLIIVEVVPFLVLAVGVDNIFILVQALQREERRPGETTDDLVSRIVGKVGPSMMLTSLSESVAFFLGALTTMPAVKVFSLYAALAVLLDFLLQISAFIALLSLDAKRMENNRIDVCLAPVKLPQKTEVSKGVLYSLMEKYFSRILLREWFRPIVMIVFVAWFCVSGAMVSKVSVGLDQSLSMPKDSYVLDYFHNMTAYLSVGPPVYFVVRKGEKYSTFADQNKFCGVSGCPQDSLVQQIDGYAQVSNLTYIAQPSNSWIDDYFSWVTSPSCCRYFPNNGSFCPSTDNTGNCSSCVLNQTENARPVGTDFYLYLPWYLTDNPNINCSKGGHAAYYAGVNIDKNRQNDTRVGANYFMTYHTVLKTSSDYINALKKARVLAANISKTVDPDSHENMVFPYSVFYVFYEQYLTIVHDSIINITICLVAIFVISTLLLGFDVYAALMVIITIIMIMVDMLGMMYLWDIDLNALSLVNLIMTIGISVEFCSHIIRAFTFSVQPTRKERAKEALAQIGSSVLSGITLTKLVGVLVLSFSKSQLFQVFYFRMYLGMVIFGATHGLIFLPVMLSYVGPPVSKAKYYHKVVAAVDDQSTREPNGRCGLNNSTCETTYGSNING